MLNDEHNSESTLKINRLLHVLMYFLALNLVVDLIVTLVNIITVPEYLRQFLLFGIQNVLIFVVLMILVLIVTIIPIIVGQRYQNWSEDKQTKVFFKVLAILSVSTITLLSIIIYLTLYSSYPLLIGSQTMITPLYRVWWYFSFNLGPILIFLLYIYLES